MSSFSRAFKPVTGRKSQEILNVRLSSEEEANAEVTCSADGVCKLYKGKNDAHSKFAFVARVREN